MKTWRVVLCVVAFGVSVACAQTVTQLVAVPETLEHEGVVAGRIDLPAGGLWRAVPPPAQSGLRFLYLLPPQRVVDAQRGERMGEIERRRIIQRGRAVRSFYWLFRQYAEAHDGIGPETFGELEADSSVEVWEHLSQSFRQSPWPDDGGYAGPVYFTIPKVRILDAEERPATATPLVLLLRPYVDDGKHWVLMSNGRAGRRPVDQALLEKHNLKLAPLHLEGEPPAGEPGDAYTLTALRVGEVKAPVRIALVNDQTGGELVCRWNPTATKPGTPAVTRRWAIARMRDWGVMAARSRSVILRTWLAAQARMYKGRDVDMALSEWFEEMRADRRRIGRRTSAFAVLGGRAAVRETLQMQMLDDAPADGTGEPVPVEKVTAVEVESHPFEEMLAGAPGGRLPLADAAPADRLFVYVARPADLLRMVDTGGGFTSGLGASVTRSSLAYDLVDRYKARLGLTAGWARMFLQTGVITEMALLCPDLFLIDGTDLTVVARAPNIKATLPLLERLGVKGLAGGKPVTVQVGGGRKAWWAVQGDLLLLSTNASELDDVIGLIETEGERSLGRTAEFRYMLTQLPAQKTTAAYVYFSDAFIRRLVGPAVKVGQLRRMRARAEMESITAGALLFRAEGRDGAATIGRLAELDYIPKFLAAGKYTLGADLQPISKTWGSPAAFRTLLERPVRTLTPDEAGAYKQYVDNYSRFWRQFFDPIAVRLDLKGDNTAELTTFILPLLDSRMYRTVRGVLATRESKQDLRVPELDPAPVLMLSLNLNPEPFLEALGEASEVPMRYGGVSRKLLDHLKPTVHFAIMDADPIVSLGSGDILGALGMASDGDDDMVWIAGFVTALLRPCKLLVELDDPQAVLRILRAATPPQRPRRGGWFAPAVSVYKVADRDAWVYTITIEEAAIKLRFGAEVVGDYLVISNQPWSHAVAVKDTPVQPMRGAALQVHPGSVVEELAALHTSAMENRRLACMQGIGRLLPFLLADAATPAEAAEQHARLFGFRPVHPAGGEWAWRGGELTSSTFGTLARPQQPAHDPGRRDFGLFHALSRADLNLQMEDTGLRTVLTWEWTARP